MKRILGSILILPLFLFCSELLPPATHSNWNIIQNDEIWIGWTDYGKYQWCKASSTIPTSIAKVQNIIEDKENYPQVGYSERLYYS